MLILGLETSCDETGVALYHTGRGLLAHALFSQVDIHVEYGGVVPGLASHHWATETPINYFFVSFVLLSAL